MRTAFSVAAVAVSCLLSGCAIHPLPEDVTGVDTYHIVRQIRCEARETIRQEVLKWLRKLAADHDEVAAGLLLKYEADPESINGFRPDLFKGARYSQVRSIGKLFLDAGIAYSFDLTMTENNDLTAGLTFTKPFSQPVVTLGAGAGAKRRRTNDRVFTVTDTFGYLLTKLNTEVRGYRYCDGQLAGPNYVYPIAGRIGIDRMVHDFIVLTLFANLSEPTAKPGAGGAPTLADKLTFTTALNGSLTPTAIFAPVTNSFQLTNATLTAGADRTDIHQVTVGLAVSTGSLAELASVRSYLFSTERGGRLTVGGGASSTVVVANRITGNARSVSEILAVLAVDQLKSRELQLIPPP